MDKPEEDLVVGAEREGWSYPIVEAGTHIFAGTMIFILVATPAILLDLSLPWLTELGLSLFITRGLIIAKDILFAADLGLFGLFIINPI